MVLRLLLVLVDLGGCYRGGGGRLHNSGCTGSLLASLLLRCGRMSTLLGAAGWLDVGRVILTVRYRDNSRW